jgi:hypothetical protein
MRTLLFALSILIVPSLASAQDDLMHLRLGAYLALGVGGDADLNVNDLDSSTELDATVGFGARGEVPIHEYFVVGGLFELLTFEAGEVTNAEREAVFNIDLWAKARYVFELTRELGLEAYVGIPIGLTLAVLNDSDGSGDDTWPGFNTGVLLGAMLLIQEHFGAFVELGWRHHQIFHEESTILGDIEMKIVTNQFAMHLGGVYQF